jgi:hypothetical protein
MAEEQKANAGARRHTYLLEPGLWTVDGLYLDQSENRHRQSGQLVIVHSPDLWTIEGEMRISGEDTRDFLSRYEITPLAEGRVHTEWKSQTGGPEPIYGLFVFVEDTVLSPWQSRSGAYWGHETLTKAGNDVYISRGFTFLKNEKVSSWAVRLIRQGGGAAKRAEAEPEASSEASIEASSEASQGAPSEAPSASPSPSSQSSDPEGGEPQGGS